jgi:integrase
MGHSDIATTMKLYNQVTAEDRAEVAVALEELLKKSA